MQIYTAVDS